MSVAQKVIEGDRWLSIQWVTGQVTRGRCGDGSGIMIRNDQGRLVESNWDRGGTIVGGMWL